MLSLFSFHTYSMRCDEFEIALQEKLFLRKNSCYKFRFTNEGDLNGFYTLFIKKTSAIIHDSGDGNNRKLVIQSFQNTDITRFCLDENGELDSRFEIRHRSSDKNSQKVPEIYTGMNNVDDVCRKRCMLCKSIDETKYTP